MKYSEHLRKLFPKVELHAEDILFLEPFQISYLPNRVPKKEFAVLLREYPYIHQHLVAKYAPIGKFFTSILNEHPPIDNLATKATLVQEALWEIAELLVYNKYPEIYDRNVNLEWKLEEIITKGSLQKKVVIDAGAGTGRIAFKIADYAQTVFAVEPVSAFRSFIRERAIKDKVSNLYVMDGFLHALPFPDSSVDYIMTSNALGWNLEAELKEIERALKPQGQAIHLFRAFDSKTEIPLHNQLIASPWNYEYTNFENAEGLKQKYTKTV